MAEPTEVLALSKISTEIDESQINVIIASQCIKAQAFLLDKLRKQSERRKETCGFISSANLKLECEIKQAGLEIHSLRNALDTIKHANVELKKEYLLAKENNNEIAERINVGERKYEQMWLESKSRYESIPYVRRLLQAQNRVNALYGNIAEYENQAITLAKEKEIKRDDFKLLDKKNIVELAEFVVHDLPRKIKIIQETLKKINDLEKVVEKIEVDLKSKYSTVTIISREVTENKTQVPNEKHDALNGDEWSQLKEVNDDALVMPKFDETNIDLDFISDKLEQVKKLDTFYIKNDKASASSGNENQQTNKYDWNVLNMEPYISPYFIKKMETDIEKEKRYSEKKLINILEDVNIGKRDAYNILSKVNPQKLQEVNKINSNLDTLETTTINDIAFAKGEVVASCTENIVVPPTQFLDSSQENIFTNFRPDKGTEQCVKSEINVNTQLSKSSQEAKKRVSFQLSTPIEISERLEECLEDNITPTNNTLDTSTVSDEDFVKIKNMVLKTHNLDTSPQFVYAKNAIQSKSPNIVTSKFFDNKNQMECGNAVVDCGNKVGGNNSLIIHSVDKDPRENEGKMKIEEDKEVHNKIEEMEVDNVIESNIQISEIEKTSVAGLLFTHGRNAIPDSLNLSNSTSVYEDGDSNFPHYIDSNLLLSPKADIQIDDDNLEVKSQEVPNFLSGLRRTGLSLFGNLPSSTPNTDDNTQNQNSGNFRFTFGRDEKKSRGGFFNIFN